MSPPQEAVPGPPATLGRRSLCCMPRPVVPALISSRAVFYSYLCPARNPGQGRRGPQCSAWHRCLLNECPAVPSLLPEAGLEPEKPAEAPHAGLSRWVSLEQCFFPVLQDCRSQSCPLPPVRWARLWGGEEGALGGSGRLVSRLHTQSHCRLRSCFSSNKTFTKIWS